MDTCSTELVILIIEYACCDDDSNQTARRLGLVSKYFRAIAEPIELRIIEVSGLKQLQYIIAKLQRLQGPLASQASERANFDVRHLFISELTMEHALASDMRFRYGSIARRSFWMTDEGKKAEVFYSGYTDIFWWLASSLITLASPNLRTLCLLTSDNWFGSRTASSKRPAVSKALGALSGASFPRLRSLTMNHNAPAELRCFGKNDSSFQCPATPSLQKLHIISPIFMDRNPHNETPRRAHPLLGDIGSKSCELTRLVLSDDLFRDGEEVLRAVFGEDWRAVLTGGSLPGKLKSVVLQQGVMPFFGCGTSQVNYQQRTRNVVGAVGRLHVDGLEAYLPARPYPGEGEREYELLLAGWKEQCIAFF